MKKKTILVIAVLAVVTVAVIAPIYRNYIKPAPSYDTLQAAFAEKGLFFPAEDQLPFAVEQASYAKSGSATIGHIVSGKMYYQDTSVSCGLWIYSPDDKNDHLGYQIYESVECHQNVAGDFRMTEVDFSCGEQSFRMVATYDKDAPDEMRQYLTDRLLESAYLMLG